MIARLSAVALVLAMGGWQSVQAQCGAVCRARAVAVKKAVVVTPVVEAIVTPAVIATFVAVPVPQYSIGPSYYPPPVAPMPNAAGSQEAFLRGEIDRLRKELDSARKPVAPPAAAPVAPSPAQVPAAPQASVGPALNHLAVFSAKCAQCHETKVAQEKGGNFVLMEGGALAKIDPKMLGKIAGRTYTGKMPPPKSGLTLSEEEGASIMEWIDSVK